MSDLRQVSERTTLFSHTRTGHQNLKHKALSACDLWISADFGSSTKLFERLPGRCPQILRSVPVGPLRGTNFGSQGTGPNLSWRVLQIGTEVAPESVYDLGSGLHF